MERSEIHGDPTGTKREVVGRFIFENSNGLYP